MTDVSAVPATPVEAAEPNEPSVPEQMRIRRDKRDRLMAAGTPAYAIDVHRTHTLGDVREKWGHLETGEETQDVVTVAGRVVFVRNTGKLAFATLQEGIGTRLQVMLSLAEVGEEALAAWKTDVDLGDHVAVTGRVSSSAMRRVISWSKAFMCVLNGRAAAPPWMSWRIGVSTSM